MKKHVRQSVLFISMILFFGCATAPAPVGRQPCTEVDALLAQMPNPGASAEEDAVIRTERILRMANEGCGE